MASPDEEAARDFLAVDSQARPSPSQPSQSLSARGARRVWISLGFLIVVVGTLSAMAWEEIPSYLSLKMRVSPESPMQIRPELQDPQHELGHPKRMLFVVHSDSNFYSSRVKWVMETWGKDLTNETLIIIGDSVPKDDLGGIIRATGCPSHSHNRGLDCKVSQDLIQADVAMQQDPSLAWAFIVDDDAYVRTDALSSFLLPKDGKGKHGKGVALGIFGCGTTDPECGGLLCGGGGLVMSREAVRITVAGPEGRGPKAFAREVAENFKKCGQWGDIAVSKAIRQRGVQLTPMQGLHGWRLAKSCFDVAMQEKEPSFMFHYQKNEQSLQMLHRIFTGKGDVAKYDPRKCVKFRKKSFCMDRGPGRVESFRGMRHF